MKYALIIGNNRYNDPKLARLKSPAADAQALANVLSDQNIGSFDKVISLVNRTESHVSRGISNFLTNKKPDDLVLVYFSGHGILDDRGRLFLALKDTRTGLLKATSIPAAFISDEMDSCRSRRQILILDCCNSGAFARGTKGEQKAVTEATFEGSGFGRVVLTASDSTQFALEGDQVFQTELSLFTHFLLEGLKTGEADTNNDGHVSLDEWYDYTYTQVLATTPKQIPNKWSYRQQGDLIIAKNPIWKKKVAELPAKLWDLLESPYSSVREVAVKELTLLLKSRNGDLAELARTTLEKLQTDDSRTVSISAEKILQEFQRDIEEEDREKVEREAAEKVARENAEEETAEKARLEAEKQARQKAAKEKAEKDAIEKARLEVEEQARQKVAKEKAEREAAEETAREKAEKDAVEKARLEAEELKRKQDEDAKEKARLEALEKARLEVEEQTRQKVAKEKAERESAEKVAREKAKKEAGEKTRSEAEERARKKTAQEKIKRETTEKPMQKTAKPKPDGKKLIRKTSQVVSKEPEAQNSHSNSGNQVAFWIVGFVVVIFVISLISLNSKNTPQTFVPTSTRTSPPTNTLEASRIPTNLPNEIVDAKGVQMMFVSAGDFIMGSDIGATDEKPAHKVYLDDFYIDEFEVTNALYKMCVDAGACDQPGYGDYEDSTYANHPVTFANWVQAKTYCEWRNARLPTEAQWEKAARGMGGHNYPWGERMDCNKTNLGGCKDHTTEVGSYEGGISPYGLYDVVGNVWEWVADWYSETYYQNSPSENPLGPNLGKDRVARGGSFRGFENFQRVTTRVGFDSTNSDSLPPIGFRCARDANP